MIIQFNNAIYLVLRLPFNPSIIQLFLIITINGVKTVEQFRAGIAELMNIKEEEYDFFN